MIMRKLIISIIRMARITGKIFIGIEITVKSLEEVVKVIIPYNYPTTLSLFPSSCKHVPLMTYSKSNSY